MLFNRRRVLELVPAAALAACAPQAKSSAAATGDLVLGSENAPVTLIEYASLMCPHCAEFTRDAFPKLKQNYIDTGKVRFIFRDFATPPREFAYAAAMLARCVGTDAKKHHEMLEVLFEQQRAIFEAAQVGQGRAKLAEIARSAGMSDEAFTACITDEAATARIRAGEEKAVSEFEITGTPTFILDGKKLPLEDGTYEKLSALIDARLAAK